MNILAQLRVRFAAATPTDSDPLSFAQAVRPSAEAKFGDYQANGCMGIAKLAKLNPRDVAESVAARVDLEPFAGKPEIAGPGFLNVRLHDAWIADQLQSLIPDDRIGLVEPEFKKTVVVDFSSPNVAKPMHIGHVRSTVIGDSLARIFEALGHRVIRDNHLGDWGSQFGMMIWGWKNHRDDSAYAADPVTELARLYRYAQSQIKPGEKFAEDYKKAIDLDAQGKVTEAETLLAKLPDGHLYTLAEIKEQIAKSKAIADSTRAETAKLHSGDAENRALWEQFMPHCLAALQAVYDRLNIRFDVQLGESFYDNMLADVVTELELKGLAVPSEGAKVVFTEGSKAPFMVQKSDGAFNYATTDLATIKYRRQTWDPDLALYVVDHRQSDHFKHLFLVAKSWGYDKMALEHVAFGTILGANRRPFQTREGGVVGLESVLDDACEAARVVIDTNSPDLETEERARVAEVVGLGAIKYADLSQNRMSDYVFDFQKMVALNGNTGAYMQYAYARIRSIFRRGGVDPEVLRASAPKLLITCAAERALALKILQLPEALELAAAELKPNVLTDYLFDLANRFSTFFEECPVLKAEVPELRESRLALGDLTARTLKFGLNLLGIDVVERM